MTLPFPPEVVAAICRHMNEDHPDDTLLICRTLGGRPEAGAATMTGLDGTAAFFTTDTGAAVRIPFSRELTTRAEVRPEVVRMYQEACRAAGLAPRPH